MWTVKLYSNKILLFSTPGVG